MRAAWLLAVWCCVGRPASWTAPSGWYINGVGPDGRFEARPVLGRPEDDLADAAARRVIPNARRIAGRIYCTGTATPRQDGAKVWCQP